MRPSPLDKRIDLFLSFSLFPSIFLLANQAKTESKRGKARSAELQDVEKKERMGKHDGPSETVNQFPPGSGLVRTFFVFTDLPFHYEFRAPDMPLLWEGFEMDVDMRLRSPEDPKLGRDVSGTYRVSAVKRVFSTRKASRAGLSQYLELSPDPDPTGSSPGQRR